LQPLDKERKAILVGAAGNVVGNRFAVDYPLIVRISHSMATVLDELPVRMR
jgi:hypothetical protein